MMVTNNGLICQRYYKEEEYLNKSVGVSHPYMYITDPVGASHGPLGPLPLYAEASEVFFISNTKCRNPKNVQGETLRRPLALVTC